MKRDKMKKDKNEKRYKIRKERRNSEGETGGEREEFSRASDTSPIPLIIRVARATAHKITVKTFVFTYTCRSLFVVHFTRKNAV